MKIVADESVDKAIVLRLRAEGHSVIYIAEQKPGIQIKKSLIDPMLKKACCSLLIKTLVNWYSGKIL